MKYVTAMLATAALLLAGVAMLGQDLKYGWTMKRTGRADEVQFTIDSWKAGNHWSTSRPYPLSAFQGFSMDYFERRGNHRFRFVQDAGELRCEGSFLFGRGSGNYTFVPNPTFLARMRDLGYDTPEGMDLLPLMTSDISLDFAREVRDAGLGGSLRDLVDLRIHGVTADYIREARDAGYRDLTTGDFTQLRIHGVSTSYLRDLRSAGANFSAGDITELRIHGVPAEFVRDLRTAGYDLSARQITELRIHGIDSSYIRDLKSYGLRPDANDLKELRIQGVTPEYLKDLTDNGYGSLPVREITELRIHGVPAEFIRQARDLGYHFTPRELTELRTQGVNGDYLRRLKDAGMRNLTASQIARLRLNGVE